MNTTIIKVTGLSKQFGRRIVLQDVHLLVPSGCVFALVGENGAGKSTLLRCLMGYHRPDQGSIRVLDYDPLIKPLELRRQVAYVSDSPRFYDWMRVNEVGWYAAGFYPQGFADHFRERAIEFDLNPNQRVRDLSKGMRSKLALALALAARPQLLILDEPTSGLDPLVRRAFLESMADLAATGCTILIASHQLHELERVVDNVAFIAHQQISVVEELDRLKQEVQRLEISFRDPLLALPAEIEQLDVLWSQTSGRCLTCMVKGLTAECQYQLTNHENILDVLVGRPTLEELYIAFTYPKPSRLGGGPSHAIAVSREAV